jgi:hypothetical protein
MMSYFEIKLLKLQLHNIMTNIIKKIFNILTSSFYIPFFHAPNSSDSPEVIKAIFSRSNIATIGAHVAT